VKQWNPFVYSYETFKPWDSVSNIKGRTQTEDLLPPSLPWSWREQGAPIRCYPTATLHGIETQKT